MEAKLGGNPLFVWRSLCWGRELLREGLGWLIANGKDIEARKRDWFAEWALSSNSTCKDQNKRVVEYIDRDGRWMEDELKRDFLPYEVEEISKQEDCKRRSGGQVILEASPKRQVHSKHMIQIGDAD